MWSRIEFAIKFVIWWQDFITHIIHEFKTLMKAAEQKNQNISHLFYVAFFGAGFQTHSLQENWPSQKYSSTQKTHLWTGFTLVFRSFFPCWTKATINVLGLIARLIARYQWIHGRMQRSNVVVILGRLLLQWRCNSQCESEKKLGFLYVCIGRQWTNRWEHCEIVVVIQNGCF